MIGDNRGHLSAQPRVGSISVALVGCGAAAERLYVPGLTADGGDPRVTTIAVDVDYQRATSFADEHGFDAARDLQEAADLGANAAIVATPHHLHYANALQATDLGLHTLVEKPATIHAAESEDLVRRARDAGVVMMVNNNRRLFPSYQAIAESIRSGHIGTVKRIDIADGSEFTWPMRTSFYLQDREARGVLLDRGAHTVDIACWWAGTPLEVVSAEHDGFAGPDAVCRLELSGASETPTVGLVFSRLNKLANRFHITGSEGELRGRLFAWNRYEQRIGAGDWRTITLNTTVVRYEEFVGHLMSAFFGAISGTPPPFELDDVLPSIAVIERAYEAATPFDLPWYRRVTERASST